MTFPAGEDDLSSVCEYLGLADDADSHATYATEAHRCFRLENPTRIASTHQESYCLGANHVSCPVYRGEGVAAAAPAATPIPARRPERQPREQKAPAPRPPRGQRPQGERPLRPGPGGPRPRAGGISMPAATVGLFVLAAVVIALAFWVQSLVGGDDGKKQVSPVDIQQTQQALRATTPGGQSTVQPPRTVTVGTPGANSTASASTTPGTATSRTPGATTTGTVSTTPGATGKTYKVQPGDTCGKIAGDNNITFEQLRKLNPEINVDCTNLNVDQVIKLQ